MKPIIYQDRLRIHTHTHTHTQRKAETILRNVANTSLITQHWHFVVCAQVCDPSSSDPALHKPGPWPKGPKPITFAEPRPEQELDSLRWQLGEAEQRLRLVQKWCAGHPQLKLVVKLVDGLRKKVRRNPHTNQRLFI